MENPYRHPDKMKSRKERSALSTRVLVDTKEVLEKAAKIAGLSVSELVANVLDDYAAWFQENGGKKR